MRNTVAVLAMLACATWAAGQVASAGAKISLAVVDENGAAIAGAQIVLQKQGRPEERVSTDYAGHAVVALHGDEAYTLLIAKPGFYKSAVKETDTSLREIRVVLQHERVVVERVNVTASVPGIDTQQTSDRFTMNMPEITNVPYPTSRDIRNLLPFYPGVVADGTGQVHVNGSETWATLDTLDGFDIRSPMSGNLAMRVSADAVRSIDEETTRYPAEYGRSTGGVIAFTTGMGDNKFRFNATNFLPSFKSQNGIRFDKFVPRVTFSGPIVKNRAWYFDGAEMEYDNIYIPELPKGADTNHLLRGSNLIKVQANLTPVNIVTAGFLWNGYHSPYDGISSLVPQESTTKRNMLAWMPYVRDQLSFKNGALLDVGLGAVRFRDGLEPHGTSQFEVTPEEFLGSYFENRTGHSQRVEGNATLYWPAVHWMGQHSLQAGVDAHHVSFDERLTRAPIDFLREDGTLLRRSTFPATTPFTRHNVEMGGYVQDRWTPHEGLLLEPGLRFDWDEIVRRPLVSPRLAVVWAPTSLNGRTKISAGVGLYYEHTQLEYLERALAGVREDTYYGTDGVTPTGPTLQTTFTANDAQLHEARALNWSVGVEQKLPGGVYLAANVIRKRVWDEFAFVNENGAGALYGNYALGNGREDHDDTVELEARKTFSGGHTLFAAYTHSTARTNAALDYEPTLTMLGAQQSGPLPWDTPNRVLSWGWVPFLLPWFRKNWDLVYALDWHTGFPYTSVNANEEVMGNAGSRRFPNYLSFSPGLEWRFHFRGAYFGLRGVFENITGSGNYTVVNNVVDSPQYGVFSEPLGRALTARLRLIGSKN